MHPWIVQNPTTSTRIRRPNSRRSILRPDFVEYPVAEMAERAAAFETLMARRRSPAVLGSPCAPQTDRRLSGLHRPPRCAQAALAFRRHVGSSGEGAIREAAEEEERVNYLENRMNDEWQEALAPIGTDHHKEFRDRFRSSCCSRSATRCGPMVAAQELLRKESCGTSPGSSSQHCTTWARHPPTHRRRWPSHPRLGRPENERPFVMFPIGYPLPA